MNIIFTQIKIYIEKYNDLQDSTSYLQIRQNNKQ